MPNESQKICKECGKPFASKDYYGYCKSCYSVIWDAGFESSSDHANSLYHMELNQDLAEPFSEAYPAVIGEMIGEFGIGKWECVKCHYVRFLGQDNSAAQVQQAKTALLEPCPKCGAMGYLSHINSL